MIYNCVLPALGVLPTNRASKIGNTIRYGDTMQVEHCLLTSTASTRGQLTHREPVLELITNAAITIKGMLDENCLEAISKEPNVVYSKIQSYKHKQLQIHHCSLSKYKKFP